MNQNNGRNYPRNYNSSGQQQYRQSNNQMRQPQSHQQRNMPVGGGMSQRNNNNMNYRRNDMEEGYSSMSGQRGNQRRFGSR